MAWIFSIFREKPYFPVLILALLVRVIYLLAYYATPEWDQLLVDSLFHHRWAVSIASGDVLGHEPFFRAPLYIYVLGGLYAIFGQSLLAGRIFGHLIGVISVLLTFRIGLRLFSKPAAIIAAVIHALYPIAVYFESELLVDSLFTMLIELSIFCLLIAVERKTPAWYFLTGLVVGAAAITRPILLALVPLYLIWLIIAQRRIGRGSMSAAVMLLAISLAIVPVALRNRLVGDDLVLISSSGGVNFYIGNNPDADGLSAAMPPPLGAGWRMRDIKHLAEQETGLKMKPSEISAFWTGKGRDWIIRNVGDFFRLYVKKLYYCINNFEVSNNRNLRLFFSNNAVLRIIPLNFGLLLALAVPGIILTLANHKNRLHLSFLVLLVVLYFLTISFFFINARFRLPIIPVIIIFAAQGAVMLIDLVRTGRYRVHLPTAVIPGILILLLSHSNYYRYERDNIIDGLFNQANFYLAHNELDRAISLYGRILSAQRGYPEASLNLGVAYMKKGLGDSAEFYFRDELAGNPSSAHALSNIASLHYLRGQYDSAAILADRAIHLKPYLTDPYLVKIRALAALGDSAGVNDLIARAEKSLDDNARLWLDAGLVYSQWSRLEVAEDYLKKTINSNPAPAETDDEAFGWAADASGDSFPVIRAKAAYQLGYIYGIQNRLAQSIAMSNLAIALDSALSDAYVNLASGYLASNRPELARQVIELARAKFPGNEVIEALSNRLQ
ncbi:MAG: glycosyltransferase family 39 protein [Candidatus Zixiibacteriota bacterium]|nr:MAG: glycosyltransferase family 39 protein [candidate division Zixibacteria bacterium]